MRQSALALLTVPLLISTACDSGAATLALTGAPSGDIVIASDLPTAGIYGDATVAALGIQLAISQHPTVGRFKLAYWSLDDAVAANPSIEKGVQNVSQMIDDPRVLGMVGPYNSYVSVDEIPLANSSFLSMISPANTGLCLTRSGQSCNYQPEALRPTGLNNYFRIAPLDPVQGTAMARYIAENRAVKRVAVINEWGSDGDDIIGPFATELKRHGGSVVLQKEFDSGTVDFTSFLADAHAKGAQAIYALGGVDDGICAARAQMTDDALFLGTDGISTFPECISQAVRRGESMLATKPDVDISYGSDAPAIKAVQAFHKKFPHSIITEYTFAAYDCAQILIAAIQRAIDLNGGGIPNRRQVLDQVARIHFAGVTGTYSFDKYGDAISPLMSVYQVMNGQWKYLSKIDATTGETPFS
jgi:branched-chain amino acid transport system substrate-binding protein